MTSPRSSRAPSLSPISREPWGRWSWAPPSCHFGSLLEVEPPGSPADPRSRLIEERSIDGTDLVADADWSPRSRLRSKSRPLAVEADSTAAGAGAAAAAGAGFLWGSASGLKAMAGGVASGSGSFTLFGVLPAPRSKSMVVGADALG